jgi:hypothetical protein
MPVSGALLIASCLWGQPSIHIDFSEASGLPESGWNLVGPDNAPTVLLDSTGGSSTISVDVADAFAGTSATTWTPSGLADWPDEVGGDYLYLDETDPVGEIILENVPEDRDYRLWLLSRTENGAETASRTRWTVNGLTGSGIVFNSAEHLAGESDQALEWRIVRAVDGQITIRGEWLSGERAGQLNGLILEDVTDSYNPATYYTEWAFPWDAAMTTLYVDSQFEPLGETGEGSETDPFRSIQAAVDRAAELDASGMGAHLIIRSGVYRESVHVRNRNNDTPLVLEAEEPGRVILLGSDVYADWQPSGEDGLWEHEWAYDFGWEPNPWPDNLPLDVPGFRRELLFVDGAPYRQVLERENLRDRTYFVSDGENRIYLDPEGDLDPREARIEVSVRPATGFLLRLERVRNVAVMGLRLQHGATAMFTGAALSLRGAENVIVEDTVITDNNGIGLEYNASGSRRVENVVLRNVRMDRNGTLGMTGVVHNLYVENCSTNDNNWRGASFGATGWAPCGFKMSYCSNVWINGLEVHNNHATGAWFDTENRYILVERMYSYNNYRHGSSLEANFGPFHIRDSVFAGNQVSGISVYDNSFVTIRESAFFNNEEQQLRFSGRPTLAPEELPSSPNWFRERQSARQVPSWVELDGNLVGVEGRDKALSMLYNFAMSSGGYTDEDGNPRLERLQRTWTSDNNRFFHPYPARVAFMFADLEGGKISFSDYQALMAADTSSEWLGDIAPPDLAGRLKAGGRAVTGYQEFDYTAPPFGRFFDPSERSEFGLRRSDWYGWMYVRDLPWVFHYEHGWQYVEGGTEADASGGSALVYDRKLGWIFLARDFYPVFYVHSLEAWVLYATGGQPGRRWVYVLGGDNPDWMLVE